MARPRKKIDPEQVRKLAERQWSDVQIGAHFGVHSATIARRFANLLIDARHNGKAKLIDILWQRGVTEKSDRVLIHLADRVLGPVPKKIEYTREGAIEFLEREVERDEADSNPSPKGKEQTD
jgi:hypothetical protein